MKHQHQHQREDDIITALERPIRKQLSTAQAK